MVNQRGQNLLQLQEQAFAGSVAVGEHVEGDPSRPPLTPPGLPCLGEELSDESSSMSFFESKVAEGMAMALWPLESMAQQSEQPSVM